MTTTFTGEVRIPGSIENGLPSTITLDAQTLILTAGGTELGRWNRSELQLRREPDGTFHLTLGREIVLFNPDSPLEFAILSGMPGAGTVPAPAPPETPAPEPVAPAEAAPVAPQPVAAPPQPTTVQPAASPAEPAIVPPAATPPATAPAAAAAPPTAFAAPVTAPPAAPAAPPGTPPPAMPEAGGPPPAAVVPPVVIPAAAQPAPPPAEPAPTAVEPSGLPPASSAAAAAVAAAASVQAPPAHPGPVEIRLETDEGAPPTPPAPAPVPPSAEPAEPAAAPRASDFWDGFHAEEQEAGVQPPAASAEAMPAAVDETPAEIHLELPDNGIEESRVGGYGSGLFTEEEASPPPAFGGTEGPAFGGTEDGDGAERPWSYYDKEGGEAGEGGDGEDRAWSYDDPKPEEKDPEEDQDEPAFRSPNAGREDLVEKSSRMKDIAAWRPSMPSFTLGASGIGMRARDVISVLDSILEENGTEDIPKSFLIGLGVLAVVLTLLIILALVF